MIEFLTQTNQSLLNQVRAKDIGTLQGLAVATQAPLSEDYVTTEDREMAAYQQAMSHQHELGDVVFDDEDIEEIRRVL